jgi:hypothetical protein
VNYRFAVPLFMGVFLLSSQSCTQREPSAETKGSPSENPTATELFNLRSRCTELGAALGKSKGVNADFTSRYDFSSNRCYVKVTYSISGSSWAGIFDGQTRELIASISINADSKMTGIVGNECRGRQGDDCVTAARLKMESLMPEAPAEGK